MLSIFFFLLVEQKRFNSRLSNQRAPIWSKIGAGAQNHSPVRVLASGNWSTENNRSAPGASAQVM